MRWRKTSRIRQEGFRKAIAFRNLGMESSVLVILQVWQRTLQGERGTWLPQF
jgi:hypothetical protein